MDNNEVKFLAALAGANTSSRWLSVGSDGDAKIVLEAPATELDTIVELRKYSGKRLLVVVTEAE